MITTFGKRVEGEIQYIPRAILTESTPGSIYEVRIKTRGVPYPEEAINVLRTELPKRFPGLKILWLAVEDEWIYIQLEGSPFSWVALLLALPMILFAIGIAVVLIAVYLVFTHIPGWTIGLVLVGILLLVLGPKIGEAIIKGIPELAE